MEGREKRIATSQEVSTSQQSKRTKQEEEENWTTVSMSHSGAPQSAPSTLQRDATTSYATNRETKYHKNARTIEETHLIQSKGSSNQGFSEEHWTSEIKSYITTQPPKFIQVIKAFRVLATDTLTLVVEVDSDPPAIFEWFCNDRPVTQDKRRFKVRHGINITTLTVEGPEQGVYKCTARNPAGISTTYGYIIVNAPPQYKKWVEQKQAIVYEEKIEISEQIGITVRQAPRFVNQVPNLTLKPGAEAVIDVEVESSPPAKFSWFVNGFEFIDTSGRVELYHPKPNRCVARFTIPQTGEYKVIAENDVGKDQSIGYIDIKKEAPAHQIQRPPLPSDQVRHIGATAAQRHHDLFESTDVGRAASVTKTYNLFESSSYDQRSMSLPRPVRSVERQVEMSTSTNLLKRHQEELEMRPPHTSMNEIYRCVEREDGSTETLYRSVADSSPFRPQAPNFTTILPESVRLSTEDKLILSVDVNAVPQADIHWHVDGKEIKQSSEVNVLNEHNRSTLVVQPPVPQGYYTATALNEAGTKNCSTAVHRVEEESFEQVDEQTILRELAMPRGRSSPPEIVQNAITVTKAHDGWEMVEEGDVMQSSNESFETVRFADTARSLSRSVGRDLDQTPQPRVAPSMQTSSFTERISEQFGGVSTDTTKTMRTMAQSSLQTEARSSKKTELYAVEEIEERRQVIAPRKISEALPKRPFVLEQPAPEVRVKAGEKLVLYSKVDSYPESSFKWYMNNFEVRPSSKVHIESAFNESRATFHKPTDGTYKVIANNIHGTCSSSTRVITEVFEESSEESSVSIVRLPQPPPPVQQFQLVRKQRFETRKDLPSIPKMTKTFASLIRVPQNEPLQLQVETEAIPPARFTWRVNNFEVRPSATVHIEQPAPNASRATFTRPTEGRYEVIAANDLGTDTCATKVVVEYESDISETKITAASPPVPPKPSIPPSFIQPLTAETILDEDTKEFSLEVLVDATRPVAFRWFADGSLLSNTVQNQMTNEAFSSTLVVRKPVLKPVNYAVEASNTNGAVWSETRVLPYIVTKTSTTVEETFSTEAVTERRQRAPRFIKPLESVELNEGDRFTTTVKVESDGAPCEFLWYLNGRDMRMMPGFRVHSTHSESTLTVDSTTVKNNGKLSVVAKNKYGSAESSSTVSIFKIEETYEIISSKVSVPSDNAPRVMSPLHSSVFKPGEQLTLRCRIDAAPPAQVTWSKDEIDLAEWVINEDITTLVLPDGTYELSKPTCTVQDAGIYQCTARNAHGKAETAAYVSVEEILYTTDVHETQMHEVSVTKSPSPYVPQVPPHFVEPMTARDEDTSTVLTCKVHSEAPVEISWYRDDIQLQQTDKHVMQSLVNGMQTLTINNVNRRDEGLYNCRAESRYGVAETTSRVATTRQTHSVEEVLIEEHNDEQIQLPQRMEFQKKVYSDTSVKLVSETEVTESEEHYSRTAELRKAEEEYKLLVKVADTVARRLVANLVVSEAVKEAVHRIREDVRTSDEEEIFFETTVVEERFHAPRFETNIECYNVRVGEVVHLATDISAHPQPTVDWYFGQQKIQQSGRTEVQYSNGRSTLVIKNARKEDEGTYICCAENRAGRSVLSCELRVIDTTSDRTETTVDFSRTTKYISTETEAEVFSNVHVNHAEETFEHHIAFIQPRTIALGYDCRASTSKVCDDSVIIRREETEMLLVKSLHELEAREKEVTLNVNVERPTPQFTHDVRILQSREEDTSFMSTEEWLVRSEEVMQTTDITLTEKQVRSHGKQSTVNTCATVVIEKPQQKAIHEVKCLYDERIRLPTERFHAVTSVDIRQVQVVNELFHSVMTRKDDHLAHEVANVEVRRPAAQFDHMTTVVESEIAHASINLTAPLRARSEIILAEVNLGRYNQSMSSEISLITRPVRRATAEQRIVILEGLTTIFSEEVIWSLKKINKSRTQLGEPVTTANVEVMKPPERGDHVVNIIDTQKIVHEILAVAAAATKYKITNVFITLTKKGETAHQALVIEYESYVEDEASLSVAVITAPAFHSKQEEIWTRETHVREVYDRRNIVDVFVEVDANCPDQSVELVASVNLPTVTEANLQNVKWWETSQIVETSISISESSSMGILQAPKFFKKLENVTSVMGRSLQFKCIVGGMPMPEIRWYVDGDEIHSTTEYETLYEDGVCILRFRELVIEDEGEYTCEATNPAGRAVTKCFLHTKAFDDVDDYSWGRSLSKKSVNEETSSYILFVAPPAAEAVEARALVGEHGTSRTPVSSIYDESQTTAATSELFELSSFENVVDTDLSLHANLNNLYVSASVMQNAIEEVRSSNVHEVSVRTRQVLDLTSKRKNRGRDVEYIQVFVNLTASLANECCEIVCRYPADENPEISQIIEPLQNSVLFVDETCISLHMSRPCNAENAAFIEVTKTDCRQVASKVVVSDVCTGLILRKPSEMKYIAIVAWDRQANAFAEFSVLATPPAEHLDSASKAQKMEASFDFMQNVHSFSDLDLMKQEPFDSAYFLMPETTTSMTVNAAIESDVSSDLWEEKFDDPFHGRNQEFELKKEENLYEPRTPLLPQRVTYKGQEIGLAIHELDLYESKKMEQKEPDRQVIERCVEAIFNLDETIGKCMKENRLLKKDGSKRKKKEQIMSQDFSQMQEIENFVKVPRIPIVIVENVMDDEDTDAPVSDLISREDYAQVLLSEAEYSESLTCNFIQKIADGTVITEEDIDMFQESEISELVMEIIEEAEERSWAEDLSLSSTVEENEYLSCSFTKEPDHFEMIVGPFVQIPADGGETPSVLDSEVGEHMERMQKRDGQGLLSVTPMGESGRSSFTEVRHIEAAIFDISDRIALQQPITVAQAEASEELLRATLEDMIMETPARSSKKDPSVYKKPIALLRQKVSDFENSFIIDEEVEIITTNAETSAPSPETRLMQATPEPGPSGVEKTPPEANKLIVKRMSSEFARVSPLTTNIQQQLTHIESMLEEVELDDMEEGDEGVANEGSKLIPKKAKITKRREMHNVLVQINHELNSVKRYCQKNITQKGVDAIVGVLGKVRNNVSSVMGLVAKGRRKRRSRTGSPDKRFSKSGFFFRSDASINFNMFREPQHEIISAIVLYRTGPHIPYIDESVPNDLTALTDLLKYHFDQKSFVSAAAHSVTPESQKSVIVFSNKDVTKPTTKIPERALEKVVNTPQNTGDTSSKTAKMFAKIFTRKSKTPEISNTKKKSTPELTRSATSTPEVPAKIERSTRTFADMPPRPPPHARDIPPTPPPRLRRSRSNLSEDEVPIRPPRPRSRSNISEDEPPLRPPRPRSRSNISEDEPPVRPLRPRSRSYLSEDEIPMLPPRPRRSVSREVDEETLIEMLASQGSPQQPTANEFSPEQIKEVSQLHEELENRITEMKSFDRSDSATSTTLDARDGLASAEVTKENGKRPPDNETIESEVQELDVKKKVSVENVMTVIPLVSHRRTQFTTLDDNSSVHLLCEESDYGNESDTGSRSWMGSAKAHHTYALQGSPIPEGNEKALVEELSALNIARREPPSIVASSPELLDSREMSSTDVAESDTSQERVHRKPDAAALEDFEAAFEQLTQSFDSDGIKVLASTDDSDQMSVDSDILRGTRFIESSSLNDVESLLGRDDQTDILSDIRVICTADPSITDMINVMPTIMEKSETSKTCSLTMTNSRSSATTATTTTDSLLPRLLPIDRSGHSQTSGYIVTNPYVFSEDDTECVMECSTECIEEPSDDGEMIYDDLQEEVDVNINLKRREQKYKVLCALAPDMRISISASVIDDECFEVIVEQTPESLGYLLKIVDDVSDSVSLDIADTLSVSVDLNVSLRNHQQTDYEEEVIAVQPDRFKLLAQDGNPPDPYQDDIQSSPGYNGSFSGSPEGDMQRTGVSISIVARSIRDIVYASLEEIPWGEVSMHVYASDTDIMIRSTSHTGSHPESLIQNVTVSESNEHERKSIKSQESFRSSQKSLAFSDRTDRYDSNQSLNIPSYVLKEGSTATITCELNNFLNSSNTIDWYKGKTKMDAVPGKIDRISHDLLEVLVISRVELADSDVYSIQVEDQVYPVACLIVEDDGQSQTDKIDDETINDPASTILSPPQTLFVMEGQPAIISCQVSAPKQTVVWCKEKNIVEGRGRFKQESDSEGFHRLVIRDCRLEDQGTYYAYLGNQFTSITLVVEEQIDEKELTVTASGTESEEEDFREYIVPPGSTATIACELEASDSQRELSWRKDGRSIVFDDDTKMEHVINGLKHYLVIHDTQPSDSACYSVRINNVEFKVAHMSVSDYATSFAGKRAKRISNTSLHRY